MAPLRRAYSQKVSFGKATLLDFQNPSISCFTMTILLHYDWKQWQRDGPKYLPLTGQPRIPDAADAARQAVLLFPGRTTA